MRSKSAELNNTELPLIFVKNSPFNKYIPTNNRDELSKILIEFLTNRSSNFIWFLIAKKRYNNNAFTHALIAVATAIPISLIDPIKSSDNTTLLITLTIDI